MALHANGVLEDGFCLLKGFLDEVVGAGLKKITVTNITFAKGFPCFKRPEDLRNRGEKVTFLIQIVPL